MHQDLRVGFRRGVGFQTPVNRRYSQNRLETSGRVTRKAMVHSQMSDSGDRLGTKGHPVGRH